MAAAKMSAAEWEERVARWHASGLKAKEFAEREGCSAKSLAWWGSELRRRIELSKRSTKGSAGFVPVTVRDVPYPTSSWIEVELASGHFLRVEPGFDVATVKRLVDAIGGGR
jgi:hypothetical protein